MLIEDMQRERCHTFDNGMNIPDRYKTAEVGTDEAEIYQQYKEMANKIVAGNSSTHICILNIVDVVDNTHSS